MSVNMDILLQEIKQFKKENWECSYIKLHGQYKNIKTFLISNFQQKFYLTKKVASLHAWILQN